MFTRGDLNLVGSRAHVTVTPKCLNESCEVSCVFWFEQMRSKFVFHRETWSSDVSHASLMLLVKDLAVIYQQELDGIPLMRFLLRLSFFLPRIISKSHDKFPEWVHVTDIRADYSLEQNIPTLYQRPISVKLVRWRENLETLETVELCQI